MHKLMTRIWKDDSGQDMAEYAIMLGVNAAVTVAVVTTLGGQIKTLFQTITTDLSTTAP